jgi:hypothetical protein
VLSMNHLQTQIKLNILPLGSYDIIVGMDCLKAHHVILKCYGKSFTCLNDEGKTVEIKGIPRKVTLRQISAMQVKRAVRKGCQMFAVNVVNDEFMDKEDKLKLEDIPVLKDFKDVFPEEIPGLPPKRDLDFTIELIPGAVPNSKVPY